MKSSVGGENDPIDEWRIEGRKRVVENMKCMLSVLRLPAKTAQHPPLNQIRQAEE